LKKSEKKKEKLKKSAENIVPTPIIKTIEQIRSIVKKFLKSQLQLAFGLCCIEVSNKVSLSDSIRPIADFQPFFFGNK
jgi:hypothetical protein